MPYWTRTASLFIDELNARQEFTQLPETRRTRLSKTKEPALQLHKFACKKIKLHSLEGVNTKNISYRANRCALAPSVGLACALPAMAQPTTGSSMGLGTTSQTATDTRNNTDDRDCGLIGLVGLRKKKDERSDARQTTTTAR